MTANTNTPPLSHGDTARQLQHCAIAVSDWLAEGCDAQDIPRPHIAALVTWTKETTAEAAAEAQPAPEPVAGVAEPLPGWKLNHARRHPDPDQAGSWEIGFLDDEDDRFSPIITVDTGLYFQEKHAEPLARAILSRLIGSPVAAEARPAQADLPSLARAAGMVCLLDQGAASCVHSEGCNGVTQEHLQRFAALVRKGAQPDHFRDAGKMVQPVAVPPEPITLGDVLDALNVFNTPRPSEGGEPWAADDFIKVSFLPAFLTVCYAAWFAAPAAPAPVALTDEEIIDIGNETHRAMPAGADDQDELLAIVRACLERAHGIGSKA